MTNSLDINKNKVCVGKSYFHLMSNCCKNLCVNIVVVSMLLKFLTIFESTESHDVSQPSLLYCAQWRTRGGQQKNSRFMLCGNLGKVKFVEF